MKNNYKYPKSKKLINKLKPFIKLYSKIEERYYSELSEIEKSISLYTGIPDIEFFFCDNEFAGVGNADRTMELIHRKDLEGAK